MSGLKGNGSVPSLPPPQPKSPPEYPDLYGKRRELAKAQMLEREIGFLEEELKSIEGLQLASRSCKEVADFVIANVDPLIPTNKKIRRSRRFWKWLCGISCFTPFRGVAAAVVVIARHSWRFQDAANALPMYVIVAANYVSSAACQSATVFQVANAATSPNAARIAAAASANYQSALLARLVLALVVVRVIRSVLS